MDNQPEGNGEGEGKGNGKDKMRRESLEKGKEKSRRYKLLQFGGKFFGSQKINKTFAFKIFQVLNFKRKKYCQ